jgi:hypothetical protein
MQGVLFDEINQHVQSKISLYLLNRAKHFLSKKALGILYFATVQYILI